MQKITLLFSLLFISVECRFVSFHSLVHEDSGQQIVLLGDYHGKETYAAENKAAIINLAHTFNGHIVVEDMSDCSLLEKYLVSDALRNKEIFSLLSAHSEKHMAYASLALTYHAHRKDVSCTNVEFRHGDTNGQRELPEFLWITLIEQLTASIDMKTQLFLSDIHLVILHEVLPYIRQLVAEDAYASRSQESLSDLDTVLAYLIDMLIIKEILDYTHNDATRMLIICAGDWHIENVVAMLTEHGYKTDRTGFYAYQAKHELRLQPIFERYLLQGQKQKPCIRRIAINMHNRKRVWTSLAKRAMTFGAVSAATFAALSWYLKARYLRQMFSF